MDFEVVEFPLWARCFGVPKAKENTEDGGTEFTEVSSIRKDRGERE